MYVLHKPFFFILFSHQIFFEMPFLLHLDECRVTEPLYRAAGPIWNDLLRNILAACFGISSSEE